MRPPAIPDVPASNFELHRFLSAIKERLELLAGERKQGVDGTAVMLPDQSIPTVKLINAAVTRAKLSQEVLDSLDAADAALSATIVDAKGDLLAGTAADTIARLAVGSDGQVLRADSSATPGVAWATPTGALAAGRNIAGRTNAATPNSKIDITADELTVRNATGGAKYLSSVNVTADITASGANGLDTGAEAANTWYYGWVIAKEDGTKAALLSTSSSAPTMPAGYTYKALVSAVRNDSGSNFIKYRQFGHKVKYENGTSAGNRVVNGGTATAETTVSVSTQVPANATFFELHLRVWTGQNGGATTDAVMTIRYVTGSDFTHVVNGHTGSGGTSFTASWTSNDVTVPNVSQQFYYLMNTATGSPSSDAWVIGFELPLGGQ